MSKREIEEADNVENKLQERVKMIRIYLTDYSWMTDDIKQHAEFIYQKEEILRYYKSQTKIMKKSMCMATDDNEFSFKAIIDDLNSVYIKHKEEYKHLVEKHEELCKKHDTRVLPEQFRKAEEECNCCFEKWNYVYNYCPNRCSYFMCCDCLCQCDDKCPQCNVEFIVT